MPKHHDRHKVGELIGAVVTVAKIFMATFSCSLHRGINSTIIMPILVGPFCMFFIVMDIQKNPGKSGR